MKCLSSEKLLKHSVTLSKLLFASCFNKPCWATFKADALQICQSLERVSEKLKRKSDNMATMRATIRATSAEFVDKDMSMCFVGGHSSFSQEYTHFNSHIQNTNFFDLTCVNEFVSAARDYVIFQFESML